MISIGYFGVVAKYKTKNISLKVIKIVVCIFALKLIVIILNFFGKENNMYSYIILIFQIFISIIAMIIYIIALRVGQYICNKNSLPGSIILKNNSIKLNKNDIIKNIFIPLLFLIIWNIIFFKIFKPKSSDLSLIQNSNNISALINLCLIKPITEEIIYRHVPMAIITDLFGKKTFIVFFNILFTSVFFSLIHLGIFENNILKLLQIFPISIILSYLNLKKGLEYNVIVHILLNTITLVISTI